MEKDVYANINGKLRKGEMSEREDKRIIKFTAKKTIAGKECYNDERTDPAEGHNYTKCVHINRASK